MKHLIWMAALLALPASLEAQKLDALAFRAVGPALTSGRVADLAINPLNPDEWYVAAASGGVWKTANHGLTFEPLFDDQGSYSIGCITLDPSNSHTVWVGTGENNNQRSVAYGDGVYKSTDGGSSWTNVGLKASEHIGMIAVHPKNSNIVWVAAYGPLWSSGGERGIYKTTDGGTTWRRVLNVSEHTGFNEVHLDPRNPNILFATAHQRRRHVHTYVSGGPESGLWKSEDGGETWSEVKNGIPGGDKGRLSLAISPVNPDMHYLMVEGHGTYRSTNRGASYSKRSDHATSGNYYVELIASRSDANTLYSMDTYVQWSEDGGATFKRLGEKNKHVDNHAFWQNPSNPKHLLLGCDGGIYETWDHGVAWHYKESLPITQFYRVSVDNAEPFYGIYGGTQDNFSLGGPSRTLNDRGIVNSDWYVTQTGDGFESQIDPSDPNIVYAQAQYGGLQRFDKKSGEGVPIKPIEPAGGKAWRWNWDAPLLISPHDSKTLYFAANVVFKSTNRGNSWTAISGDLSRQLDRHLIPVMGKIQGLDAIAYKQSTSMWGTITALHESPKVRGLLAVGTDDGLIHVSSDAGANWTKLDKLPGIPDLTFVNDVKWSQHSADVLYAVFNNHKNGDFKPYLMVSKNRGKTWEALSTGLPQRGSTYVIAEDHKDASLLFVGTEFGVFSSTDGGLTWTELKKGLPTVAVRDIAIQQREDDLVLATFGRGFYVLDDYSPLREIKNDIKKNEAIVLPIKPVVLFHEASPLGYGGAGFLGAGYYMADNPKVGATFTYWVKNAPKTLKEQREELEKKNSASVYPSKEAIRAEAEEAKPHLSLVIRSGDGKVVRILQAKYVNGLKRSTWDGKLARSASPDKGSYLAPAGNYSLQLVGVHGTKIDTLTKPLGFKVSHLSNLSLPAEKSADLVLLQSQLDALQQRMDLVSRQMDEVETRLDRIEKQVDYGVNSPANLRGEVAKVRAEWRSLGLILDGDELIASKEFETMPGLRDRLSSALWGAFSMRSDPTQSMKDQRRVVAEQLTELEKQLLNLLAQSSKW
ncbi:MAG: glycosyl hydrolase [Schleiferiaceae bacterium]|nr:glycosyl hydrolase [Schleiferiaceae bacterium]MDP4773912.1 glycosyl hydrolase [Schleiferiaceae bacterium]MDP4932928.1 glycosyl hydrolase [Schleiferiaceae bacterium]